MTENDHGPVDLDDKWFYILPTAKVIWSSVTFMSHLKGMSLV